MMNETLTLINDAMPWVFGAMMVALVFRKLNSIEVSETDCNHSFDKWSPPERSHSVDGRSIYSQHRTCNKCNIVYERKVNG